MTLIIEPEDGTRLVEMVQRRPRTRKAVQGYIYSFLGWMVPGKRICPGHDSPLDYVSDSILRADCPGDMVVCANRGGGKTLMGAAVSLLECLFYPRASICILGGSQEQSQLMYNYIRQHGEGELAELASAVMKARGCQFDTGATIEVLTQSQKSVRGKHIQRLRCDEVELFDEGVWQAAQFVTQSSRGLAGRLEVLSTMHCAGGLMSRIIQGAAESRMRVYRWCLWEVIERCEGRTCSQCPLLEDCQGRAREAVGYYRIDDAIGQKRRSSRAGWRSEMLCLEPQRHDAVFEEFDPASHVAEAAFQNDRQTFWAIDFGFSNPFAALLIQTDGRRVYVLEEHIVSRVLLRDHGRHLLDKWPFPAGGLFCDPAGFQRNEITGTSPADELRAMGLPVCWRQSGILEGLELMRQFMAPALGEPRLIITPRCPGLILAMQSLRYARLAGGGLSELHQKDGIHDHVVDALRYFFVNRFGKGGEIKTGRY